jgi:ribose transport system substrate-binding protein
MLRVFTFILLSAFAILLTGCPAQNQNSGVKVAFVSNNPAEFWTLAEAGARKGEKETGVQLIFKRPQDGTAGTQKQIIEDLLTQGVKAIAISVIDPKNQTSFINEIASRVPVICVDNDAADSKRRCYMGTANLQAGRSAGKMVLEAMPEGGKVAIFVGQLDPVNARERRQGVIDVLEGLAKSEGLRESPDGKKYGKYEVIGTYTDGVNEAKAKDNAADVLTRYQNEPNLCLVGLWAYNPPAILGAAADANRLGKIKIVGFDEDNSTLEGIKKGDVHGTVVQQPFEFGYQSVLMMAKMAKGADVTIPKNGIIDIPHREIRKADAAAFQDELKKLQGK